jgi:hypothetical protein
MRTVTTIVGGGLAALALSGSGIAHADSSEEQEAWTIQRDVTWARRRPNTPSWVLRAKMAAEDARNVMSQAAQDFCPNHITDLPASWR